MEILIAGAGRVGYRLASSLCAHHDVYVIDKNPSALERLSQTIDILPIEGDVEDPATYRRLPRRRFDTFVAVTDSDEANILSTLIASDAIDVERKIIRLKNPYFATSSIAARLGISDAVFPYLSVARSIEPLIRHPKARNIKKVPFTKLLLFSVTSRKPAIKRYGEMAQDAAVVAYERDGVLHFDDAKAREGDLVYLLGPRLEEALSLLDTSPPRPVRRVALFGAQRLGVEIAKELAAKVELKLIDDDPKRCEEAARTLDEGVCVISSRYMEESLYDEEYLAQADMVICSGESDERNIVQALKAKEHGIWRTIAINNHPDHYDLMHRLNITPIRGPKMSAYYQILEKIASSSVVAERLFCGGRGVLFARRIERAAKVAAPKFGGRLFIARGDTVVQSGELRPGDVALLFVPREDEPRAKRWIERL